VVKVNEKGFMPMSFAAALMLVVVVLFMVHVSEADVRLQGSDATSAHELASLAALLRTQMDGALRYAAYAAFREVSKEAWKYSSEERLQRIQGLTADYLSGGLQNLMRCTELDPRVRLDAPSTESKVLLSKGPDGRVNVQALFPGGVFLRLDSRDERTTITIPIENLSVELDSRYFLLQDLMENFLERMGDVNTCWGVAEYLTSWGEAWTTGMVTLSRARTVALFEAAWALHEFNVFGSTDCSAILLNALREICFPIMQGFGTWADVHVEKMERCIKEALFTLNCHKDELELTLEELRKAETLSENEFFLMIMNAVRRIVEVRDELNQTREILLNLREIGEGQLQLGLNGLLEKIDAVLENLLLAKSSCSSGKALYLKNATDLLLELTTISGTVGCVDVQDDLGRWRSFPVFVDSPGDATLPRVCLILEGALHDLEVLSNLTANSGDASGFQELLSKVGSAGPILERKDLFSVFPQAPLSGEPGVSAFHEFNVEKVRFHREDPAGQLGLELATPIPLWFIGATVWWGQWEITLTLGKSDEAILDFPNKTIPVFTEFGGAHVPLKYRWNLDQREFKVRVAVASLKPFSIKSTPEFLS